MGVSKRIGKRGQSAIVGRPFGSDGGPDPSEAGRAGGIRSGESRRNKRLRDLEERILSSGNGYAHLALLKQLEKRERDNLRERERAVAKREREVADQANLLRDLLGNVDRLTDERDELYADIERLEETRARAETELADLRRTIAELAEEHDLELVEDE